MRIHSLMAAVAAATMLAFTGAAQAQTVTSGYIGAEYNYLDVETAGGDDEENAWGVNGAIALPLGAGNVGLQLDAAYDYIDQEPDEVDTISGTAHLFHRNEQRLLGVYAGIGSLDDETLYGVGVEGDFYTANWTLGGRAGWATVDDADIDTWSIEGRARYFYSDDLYIQAGLGWERTEFDAPGADDSDAFGVGVGGEYQFAAAPVSVYGGVRYQDGDGDAEATTVRIGLRLNFRQSLKDRDRTGASQENFTRAIF